MSSQLIELGHQALAPLIGSHPLWLWVVAARNAVGICAAQSPTM
jgi:hypothetical protein